MNKCLKYVAWLLFIFDYSARWNVFAESTATSFRVVNKSRIESELRVQSFITPIHVLGVAPKRK